MDDINKNLDKFQKQTQDAYVQVMKLLEENYCWKCPMRSTNSISHCREVHIGRVLLEAANKGIVSQLQKKNFSPVEVDALITRILKKIIKKQGGKQKEKIIILKVEAEQNLDLSSYCGLMIKINPRKVQKGEEILIPDKPTEYPLLGAYALIAGFPFQLAVVKRVFHEGNFWYVELENMRVLPLESIFGVLIKMLEKEIPLQVD